MDKMFDVCVIGAGLWGSAAARHLSQKPGIKVCLIGPDEPKKEIGQELVDGASLNTLKMNGTHYTVAGRSYHTLHRRKEKLGFFPPPTDLLGKDKGFGQRIEAFMDEHSTISSVENYCKTILKEDKPQPLSFQMVQQSFTDLHYVIERNSASGSGTVITAKSCGLLFQKSLRHAMKIPISLQSRVVLHSPGKILLVMDYPDAEVLGSHYDEGRITTEAGSGIIWDVLAERSVSRYRHLEKITGISFYSEVGHLLIGLGGSDFLSSVEESCKNRKINFQYCSQDDLCSLFPYLKCSPDKGYLFTRKRSGHISPRKLIIAQKTVAELQGCEIINDTVMTVKRTCEGGQRSVCMSLKNNGEVYANRILLCTGAFTNFLGLLEEELKLDISVGSEIVVKTEVSGKELANLKDMPSMIKFTGVMPDVDDFYLLPPIKYPNGKFYLKLGHHKSFMTQFNTLEEVKDWFIQGGDKNIGDYLLCLIHNTIDFKETSVEYDSAVTTETPSGYPYCGMVSPNIGVLVGGNGQGAMSSDEVGRMGANMIKNGRWDHDMPEENFRPRLKRNSERNSKL